MVIQMFDKRQNTEQEKCEVCGEYTNSPSYLDDVKVCNFCYEKAISK